jgi:hypothetical protein
MQRGGIRDRADGKPVLMKLPKVELIDDGPGKAVSIALSGAGRSLPSATRMATHKCWSGQLLAVAQGSWPLD